MTNNRDRGKIDCPTNRSNAPLPKEERDRDDDATGHDDSAKNQAGPGETLREQSTASGTKLATDGGSIVEDELPDHLTKRQTLGGTPLLRCLRCGSEGPTHEDLDHRAGCPAPTEGEE